MKEQLKSVILPALPIVGKLKLTTRNGKSLYSIEVVTGAASKNIDSFFKGCFDELHAFLTGEKKEINIKLDFTSVTPFQLEVLKTMKKIPYGKTATYKDIAVKMKSSAYQAIGSACGRNPFLLIYPCHRVVASKNLGGFAHGLPMKKQLLNLEDRSLIDSFIFS
jgi:O-6-methylguanine DNA methyltransferase